MSEELLPCPFCGTDPVTERTGFSGRAMYIYCINDNGCPRPKAVGETEEKAIENWNTRTPPPPTDALVKALEASDDIIREVANSYNMETPEGRRISGELAKIIAANRAALSLTRADRCGAAE